MIFNRLRRYHPAPLPAAGVPLAEPEVETPGDRQVEETVSTDPVCGMTVDPATATERRDTGTGAVWFCSAGCAAAFDEEHKSRVLAPGTAAARAEG